MSDVSKRTARRINLLWFAIVAITACVVHYLGGYSIAVSFGIAVFGMLANGLLLLLGDICGSKKAKGEKPQGESED